MGTYAAVLHALNNMDKDLLLIAIERLKKMNEVLLNSHLEEGSLHDSLYEAVINQLADKFYNAMILKRYKYP